MPEYSPQSIKVLIWQGVFCISPPQAKHIISIVSLSLIDLRQPNLLLTKTTSDTQLRGRRKKLKSLEPRRSQRKRKALLRALRVLRGSLLSAPFATPSFFAGVTLLFSAAAALLRKLLSVFLLLWLRKIKKRYKMSAVRMTAAC